MPFFLRYLSSYLKKCGARCSLRTWLYNCKPKHVCWAVYTCKTYICATIYSPQSPFKSCSFISPHSGPTSLQVVNHHQTEADSSPGHIVVEAQLLPPSLVFCSLHTGPHFPMAMWGTTALATPQPPHYLPRWGNSSSCTSTWPSALWPHCACPPAMAYFGPSTTRSHTGYWRTRILWTGGLWRPRCR